MQRGAAEGCRDWRWSYQHTMWTSPPTWMKKEEDEESDVAAHCCVGAGGWLTARHSLLRLDAWPSMPHELQTCSRTPSARPPAAAAAAAAQPVRVQSS